LTKIKVYSADVCGRRGPAGGGFFDLTLIKSICEALGYSARYQKAVAVAACLSVHTVLAGQVGNVYRGGDGRANKKQRSAMSPTDDLPKPERIPFFQRVLDNPFLLLFLGIVMPTVFYILWGVMEIATLPIAP
jgi:hypothetical protein